MELAVDNHSCVCREVLRPIVETGRKNCYNDLK